MTSQLSKQRQVFNWLHSLELPHHFERFIDNGYDDLDICVEIRDSDLSAIGIIDIHERIALLQAVRELRHKLQQQQQQHHQRSPPTNSPHPNSNHHHLLHHHNPHQQQHPTLQSQKILCSSKQTTKSKGKSYPNLPTNPEFHQHHHNLLHHHHNNHRQNNSSWNVPADQHQEFLSVYHLHRSTNHLDHNNQQNNNLLDNNNYSVVCSRDQDSEDDDAVVEYRDHQQDRHPRPFFLVGGGGGSSNKHGCKNPVNGITTTADVSNFDNGCDDNSEPFYESLSPHHEPSLASVSVSGVGGVGDELNPKSTTRNNSSGANLILRTQLRDQVIQDGINISRIPDEMTLRAVAAQYASELSFSSSGSCTSGSGSSSNGNNRGESSRNSTSNSNCNSNSSPSPATATQAPSWITQGLPLLDFQEAVLDQLREIWLEERSKLFPSCNSASTITMSSSSYATPQDAGNNGFETSTTTLARSGFAANMSPSTATPAKCKSLMTNAGRQLPGPPPPHHYPIPIVPDGFRFHSTTSPHHSNNANANAKGSPTVLVIPSNNNAANASSDSPEHQFQSQSQPTPRHGQRHQYLHHVIISNSPSESEQNKPVYTPGIYLPSSCLRDKDDIYDYVPLVHRSPYHSPSKRSGSCLSQTTKQQSKGKANKLKDKNYGTGLASTYKGASATQTSPRRTHNLSTIRLKGSSMSSYAISGGCCSPPVSNGSSAASYGFVNYGQTGTLPSGGKGSSGCRTLANLSKLSRRLGLARFFRTLRLHQSNGSTSSGNGNSHQNAGNHRKHYFTSVDSTAAASSTIATVSELEHQQRHHQQHMMMHKNPSLFMSSASSTSCSTPGLSRLQRVPNSNDNPKTPSHQSQKQSQYGSTSLSSLPSNERIIETINRLKYEELQRRKERIAQEHQMMLKELKESMSANTSNTSSIFYVSSNSNENTSDYMYEGGETADIDVEQAPDDKDPPHNILNNSVTSTRDNIQAQSNSNNVLVEDGKSSIQQNHNRSILNHHTYDDPAYESVEVVRTLDSESDGIVRRSFAANDSLSTSHSSQMENPLIQRESDCDCKGTAGNPAEASCSSSSSSSYNIAANTTGGPGVTNSCVVPSSGSVDQLSGFHKGLGSSLSFSGEGASEPRGNKSECTASAIFNSSSGKSLHVSTSEDTLEKPLFGNIGINNKKIAVVGDGNGIGKDEEPIMPHQFLSYGTSPSNENIDRGALGGGGDAIEVRKRLKGSRGSVGSVSKESPGKESQRRKRNSVGNIWQLFTGSNNNSTMKEIDSDTSTTGRSQSQRSSGVSSGPRTSSSSESFTEIFARNLSKIKKNKVRNNTLLFLISQKEHIHFILQ